MADRIVLLEKTYDGESIVDAFRDTSEAFVADFTPAVKDIPTDEHGFQKGTFRVLIEWLADGVSAPVASITPAMVNAAVAAGYSGDIAMHIYRLMEAARTRGVKGLDRG